MIPPITDPLGRHWQQPSASEYAVDDSAAMMTPVAFKKLLEYSSSIPSGKYAGKMWKCRRGDKWFLRWYEDDPRDPESLLIPAREIVVIDNYPPTPNPRKATDEQAHRIL